MALISSESITLMVNGTLQSEFFTMFWPTRFTYSTRYAGVDVKEAARQRHGVDLVGIDHLDGERHLTVGVLHDVLAHPVHVLHHHRIGHQVRRLLNLHRVLLAHADLAVDRVPDR